MFLIVAAYGESNVSRRLVNLPYIALQVVLDTISLYSILATDCIFISLQIGLLAPPFAFFIYRSFTTPVSRRGRRGMCIFSLWTNLLKCVEVEVLFCLQI